MTEAPRPVLMLVTAGSRDEAERLGEGLVERRLAACGSVVPMIHSFFRWEGRLQREHEALLLVKTSSERVEQAKAYVLEHHSYQVPEIITFDIDGGSPAYLDWLLGDVGAE